MGASSIRSFSIAFVLMGIAILYFAPNSHDTVYSLFPLIGIPKETVKNLLRNSIEYVIGGQQKIETGNDVEDPQKEANRLFTPDELKKYDGTSEDLGLYLAILGEVFDVSKGAQHYKPGGGYSFFSGRDASKAYVTGDFTEDGLSDDLSGLDDASLSGIEDWLSFYKEEYKYIGRVVGRYYDQKGNPTSELKVVKAKIESGRSNKWVEDNEKEVFPPCNSEWSKEIGSRVWCTEKSGGIQRNWIGVPRKLYKVGKDARCVCVRESGPPSSQMDSQSHSNLGDLEHPSLHEYPNCPSRSTSCKVDHP